MTEIGLGSARLVALTPGLEHSSLPFEVLDYRPEVRKGGPAVRILVFVRGEGKSQIQRLRQAIHRQLAGVAKDS